MLRLAVLLGLAMSGPAFAAADCDAAAARWVELMPPAAAAHQAERLGMPMDEIVQTSGTRWTLAVSMYIGTGMAFDTWSKDTENKKRLAETVLVLDQVIDCWRPEMAAGSTEQQAQLAKFEGMMSADQRASFRNVAAGIMKDGN